MQLPDHIHAFIAKYADQEVPAELIQTHISWVVLTGRYAYKFKKPVNFSFLDFTTLEKRHYYCERELELNRRLSPEIYLELVPIRQECDGAIIDYALKMQQFAQSDLLDQRLNANRFDAEWMDQLAADTASFHAQTEIDDSIDHIGLLKEHIDTNISQAEAFNDPQIDTAMCHSLRSFAEQSLQQHAKPLQQRQIDGHIRHCHGDLHLKNIALIKGRARLFDCIEFNESFSRIDTLNDIAFLVMDCDARGRPDLGFRFLSRYLELTNDYQGLQLLPLYLFYRATVRGKVALLLDGELEGEAKQLQIQEAVNYYKLACRYSSMESPMLYAVAGYSGSGKSHLALAGCGKVRAIIIRSDATRKRLATEHPELPLYGSAMQQLTYRAIFSAAEQLIRSGFSVILDATFLDRELRRQIKSLSEKLAVPLHFYWLDIAPETLKARIKQRSDLGNDISDADLKVLDMQLAASDTPDEPWITYLDRSDRWPENR